VPAGAETVTESGHKIMPADRQVLHAKSKTPYATDQEVPMVGKVGKH
jgi:hypothetical protein